MKTRIYVAIVAAMIGGYNSAASAADVETPETRGLGQ